MVQRIKAYVRGRVQGVGFRPTVYRYARSFGLSGNVYNTAAGVVIEVQGETEKVNQFFNRLLDVPPPQARIEHIHREILPTTPLAPFSISPSDPAGVIVPGFPPDLGSCEDCLRDITSPTNRRYRYPFANCTNCGPRFTIIQALPYDRQFTTMSGFAQCSRCGAEFADPHDRRFEAQPNACPDCGPRLALRDIAGRFIPGDPIRECARLLAKGAIVAVKGLGGFHLVCDAANTEVIALLRARKNRPAKPLAVMFSRLAQAETHCQLSPAARKALAAPSQPIVICRRRPSSSLPALLAPDTHDLGIMLPYTPLHYLLLSEINPLVMTSGNRSEEPIVHDERALNRILGPIADFALVHDRPIVRACDDSVLKITGRGAVMLRRARGYVPDPCVLPIAGPSVLACGGDLKNTFCLTRSRHAWLSQHLGDLSEYTAFMNYQNQLLDWQRLLGIEPQVVAHDLHPDYHSTRFARTLGHVHVPVQHHHAHIAACMAEHGLNGTVIGVAFDGSGYGPDHTVWGGEFLIATYRDFIRAGHLKAYPLPGSEQAILHPARMGLSYLFAEFGKDWESRAAALLPSLPPAERGRLAQMLQSPHPLPQTSSAGRLFDAVSAWLGFDERISYEGQAAVHLQTLAGREDGPPYPFLIERPEGRLILSFAPMFAELLADLRRRSSRPRIAARFHRTVAVAIARVCSQIGSAHHVDRVALGGGVFQNDLLLAMVCEELNRVGLQVYFPVAIPPNDGGLALGQAAVALAALADPARKQQPESEQCA